MGKKTINARGLRNRFKGLYDKAYNNIIDTMTERRVKAISFLNNGDNSNFDVDRSYASVENPYNRDTILSKEIILVVVEGRTLYIATADDLTTHQLVNIEGDVYSANAWEEVVNTIHIDVSELTLIDETYTPLQTISDLAWSIDEVLEGCMQGKPLKKDTVLLF